MTILSKSAQQFRREGFVAGVNSATVDVELGEQPAAIRAASADVARSRYPFPKIERPRVLSRDFEFNTFPYHFRMFNGVFEYAYGPLNADLLWSSVVKALPSSAPAFRMFAIESFADLKSLGFTELVEDSE